MLNPRGEDLAKKVSFTTKDGKKVSFTPKKKGSKKTKKKGKKSKSSPTKNKKKGGKKTAKSKSDKPKRRTKKYTDVRLSSLVRFTIDYTIAAGHPPGPVVRQLIMDVRAGGGQVLDLILAEFLAVWDNIEYAPVNTIGRLALFEWFWWAIVKPNLPKRKLLQVGKIRVFLG